MRITLIKIDIIVFKFEKNTCQKEECHMLISQSLSFVKTLFCYIRRESVYNKMKQRQRELTCIYNNKMKRRWMTKVSIQQQIEKMMEN